MIRSTHMLYPEVLSSPNLSVIKLSLFSNNVHVLGTTCGHKSESAHKCVDWWGHDREVKMGSICQG